MKLKRFRFISVMVIIILVLVSMMGCAKESPNRAGEENGTPSEATNSQEQVTIRFGHMFGTGNKSEAKPTQELIKRFEEENPNIKVVVESVPGEEFKTKIKVDLASNNLPDIFIYWTDLATLRPLVEAEAVLDMSQYTDISNEISLDQWSGDLFSLGAAINDTIYQLPLETVRAVTLYNKEIFEKYNLQPPQTYEEMIEVAEVLKEQGIIPLAMGSKGANPAHHLFAYIMTQFQGGGMEAREQLSQHYNFSTEAVIQAAKIMDDMRQRNFYPADTVTNGGWDNYPITYNQGKSAMLFTLPWMIANIDPEVAEISGMMDFPKMPNAVLDPSEYTMGGLQRGVTINKESFKNEKLREAIVKFADALLSDEFQQHLIQDATVFPAKSDIDVSSLEIDPFFKRIADHANKKEKIFEDMKSQIPTSTATEVFVSSIDELAAGVITPEEFVAKVQTQLDKDKK